MQQRGGWGQKLRKKKKPQTTRTTGRSELAHMYVCTQRFRTPQLGMCSAMSPMGQKTSNLWRGSVLRNLITVCKGRGGTSKVNTWTREQEHKMLPGLNNSAQSLQVLVNGFLVVRLQRFMGLLERRRGPVSALQSGRFLVLGFDGGSCTPLAE
eukprot:2968011-Amphidinium_carterae.2